MPRVNANGVGMNYDQQGTGEPLILIPYLAADHACYAFQVAEYAKHFTCISIDLRGSGGSDDPEGDYTTETLADDVAALMQALGIANAHIGGLSLGANVGMWLAAKHREKVRSLSLHAGCPTSDSFIRTIVASWRVLANALNSVPEMVISGIFPWCFTPELYAARPDYIQALSDFVRSRPPQSLPSFMRQSDAVIAHDVSAQLGRIAAPTQITLGSLDQITSTRFALPMKEQIRGAELLVFEGCAHAHIYERVEEFNEKSLQFLLRHTGAASGSPPQSV
jgi:pimeloyl-ACP methyl ester carboxylesterase